ncbi:class I SAM-dependent methyltransferase [Candidatus Giovannonibacteria bacterium]|nr:class I SAM-dependent methyltransferase [Candidatus Giovannonibacteria bacterium]
MKTKIYENLAELFPLWRETTLGKVGHEREETNFVIDIFKKYSEKIEKVIDLGGGVGLHSGLLLKAGYDVTLFDQSEKALSIAKKNYPDLKVIHGQFETININQEYNAAICMWSTLSYIFSEEGRRNFYDWQKTHIKKIVILDEANFYRYNQKFHKTYLGENDDYKMKVIRDWELTDDNLKKTKFVYEIFDKKTGKSETIEDAENGQYVEIERLKEYFGVEWNLEIYGDYNLDSHFKKEDSPRIIPVFFRKT